MQKLLLISFILSGFTGFAQAPEDALRYSFYPQNGTARNLAIGSAMGSLGGDINASFVNPAGLGFFKTGEFVFSPGFNLNSNRASFRENDSKNNKNGFTFGTTGMVWGKDARYGSRSGTAFSLALTQTANFNNRIQYQGLNNYSSFSEQFAEEFAKSGYSIDQALNSNSAVPYGAAPALFTYLIDTVRVNGFLQVRGNPENILDAGQALRQEMNQTTKGGIYELGIGIAQNNNDKWLIGLGLGIQYINYKSNTNFKESDTSSNVSNGFKQFEYTDEFSTQGAGVNAKLGLIYRPREYFRLGLAIHTPSFMQLTDKRTTQLTHMLEPPTWSRDTTIAVSSKEFSNNAPGKAEYGQSTPFKAILSASYVFREISDVSRQKGFITADLEYVHHKQTKFSSNSESATGEDLAYYKSLNDVVKASYKGAFNFRAGGELKFNTIMGRLGFAYYGNPYKDEAFKANRMLLSGGLGYRHKGIFLDLTYVHAISKDVHFPYRLEDRANTFASLKQTKGTIMATLGFKF